MALFAKDAPANAPAGVTTESRPRGVSTLSAGVSFDGTLTGSDNLIIEGSFKGSIDVRSEIRIAASARLEATIHGKTVIVEGTVSGDVSAEQKIELLSNAKVEGNIKAPKIVVAEGASFRGAVDMGTARPKDHVPS